MKIDKKKSSEILSGIVQSTVDLSKKAVAGTKAGVNALIEKSKTEEKERKVKKYHPLFPDQFKSADFHIPNIIVIVDDAIRRDVDVCEGAIGWLEKENGDEVLYLYDEAIEFSKIAFIPAPVCNSVYHVHNFDRSRFIQADHIFKRSIEEKKAELRRIAECIGAKRCSIYISELTADSQANQASINVGADISEKCGKKTIELGGGDVSADYASSNKSGQMQYGRTEVEFGGFRFPKRPKLEWFAHDNDINDLINSCCTGRRRVKSMTLELAGNSSATMTKSVAGTIDGIYHKLIKFRGGASLSKEVESESQSKMIFSIEF